MAIQKNKKFILKKNQIKNVKFGKNVKIISPVNLYDCEIADDFMDHSLKYKKM